MFLQLNALVFSHFYNKKNELKSFFLKKYKLNKFNSLYNSTRRKTNVTMLLKLIRSLKK